MRKVFAAAAACAAVAAFPAAASAANPVVDQAVAAYHALGIPELTAMPSGRTAYRNYEDYNSEMDALAAANPGFVSVKQAKNLSIEGRVIKYLEITNNVDASEGKPVFYLMGAIHGNETAAAEDDMEFAYDIVNQSKAIPAVKALFDKVRVVIQPVVNVDGYVHNRRANCDSATPLTPHATCPTSNSQGVDMNRNYPFGWGSNIGVTFAARGKAPGSEPEMQNTMDIIEHHPVVDLITTHTNERAIFYPPLDVAAGDTPELNSGYKDLALSLLHATNDGYTNTRDSAHDYETSGETIDWAYYATRSFAFTMELIGPVSGCPQSHPDYLNCTRADFTGVPGPTSSAAQTAQFNGHASRDAFWQGLVYASLPAGHSVITGTAPAGAKLTLTKDFNLYTAPIKQNTTPAATDPPMAVPTHLETSMVVPASGRFTWDVNPSVRAVPAFQADGEHGGPNGFYYESYTVTCTAPDGTLLESSHVMVDRGQSVNMSLCTQGGVSGTVPATLSLTLGAPASFGAFTPGIDKTYTASTTADVISTAGDATLSVSASEAVASPPGETVGHMTNGAFSLKDPLVVTMNPSSWSAPASHGAVAIGFSQHIGANDALRTGTYSRTLTFTLSTTTP